jgi:signal transduction histidine kinase
MTKTDSVLTLPRFADWSLATRFAAAGGIVMLIGMGVIGYWVTDRIKTHVIADTAQSTALFMDSVIAPLTTELTDGDVLSAGPVRALEEMLASPQLAGRVIDIKIWKKGGLVAWASQGELTGQRFPPGDSLRAAWQGRVVAEYDDLAEDENILERRRAMPLLEIYSPIREHWSGQVIAVAEFYENATGLKQTLRRLLLQSWMVVGLTTLAMALSLYGIVAHGSRLIEQQRNALTARMEETRRIAGQNADLRERVQRASAKASELNEQYLRRISADLHDGPAQLVGLAALKLDSLNRMAEPEKRSREIAGVRKALDDAMQEIRSICTGLSLPDIEGLAISAVIARATREHEERTHTPVALDAHIGPEFDAGAPHSVLITVYRFVQEGLNNAFRHAGGEGQAVAARIENSALVTTVSDAGAANTGSGTAPTADGHGLGLAGLHERIESMGGQLSFERRADGGSVLEMRLRLYNGGTE